MFLVISFATITNASSGRNNDHRAEFQKVCSPPFGKIHSFETTSINSEFVLINRGFLVIAATSDAAESRIVPYDATYKEKNNPK